MQLNLFPTNNEWSVVAMPWTNLTKWQLNARSYLEEHTCRLNHAKELNIYYITRTRKSFLKICQPERTHSIVNLVKLADFFFHLNPHSSHCKPPPPSWTDSVVLSARVDSSRRRRSPVNCRRAHRWWGARRGSRWLEHAEAADHGEHAVAKANFGSNWGFFLGSFGNKLE